MLYEINLSGTTKEVLIETVGERNRKKFSVTIGGNKSEIELLQDDPEKLIVSIKNKVYLVKVLKTSKARVIFSANSKIIEARLKQSEVPEQEYSAAALAGGVIKSNFPAKIIKINAAVGDSLSKGESFIVLEAMKMEAQIKAPTDCTVSEIFVKEGEMVERGKTLAKLELR
jgi:biotin carboxyl carrier protein